MKVLISLFLVLPFHFLLSQGIGINTAHPQAMLHVDGDFKFVPKITTATRLVGVVANGEVKEITLGSTFNITNNTLNATPEYDANVFLLGNVDQSGTAASVSQYDNFSLRLRKENGNKTILRITGETNGYNVTGFAGGYDGRTIYFYNDQVNNVTFFDNNTASAAENRILTGSGANEGISGQGVAEFIYDGIMQKWILINIRS